MINAHLAVEGQLRPLQLLVHARKAQRVGGRARVRVLLGVRVVEGERDPVDAQGVCGAKGGRKGGGGGGRPG